MSSTLNSVLVFFGAMVVALLIFLALGLWFEHIERMHRPKVDVENLELKSSDTLVLKMTPEQRHSYMRDLKQCLIKGLPEGDYALVDYAAAIEELTIAAETCESNAPIHEDEGNVLHAAASRKNAVSYRAAISALQWMAWAHHASPAESGGVPEPMHHQV